MSFEKMISIVLSWPVTLIVLMVVMAVFGWRKYRLDERSRKIVENASEKTFVIISVVLALVISARITGEYYYELFGLIDQFTHGTGIEAPWFIVVIGLLGAGFAAMVFLGIADGFAAAKLDRLSVKLDETNEWVKYDRARTAMAARDPLAGCEFYRFSVDKDGNMIKTSEEW